MAQTFATHTNTFRVFPFPLHYFKTVCGPLQAFRAFQPITSRMKVVPLALCVGVFLLQSSFLFAQNNDSSGTTVLEQALAASGGRIAWTALRDFRAAGTIALHSGGNVTQSGGAELIGRGMKQFRLTADFRDHTRSWLWNKGFGRLDIGNGKPGLIGRHNLIALEGFNLPALKLIAFSDGPSRSVTLVGTETVEGIPAYRVRITRQGMNHEDRLVLGRASFQFDLLIDQKTFMVLAIEDTLYPNNQPEGAFQHRVEYSDYRSIAGTQIPFRITETIAGQVTWDLHMETYVVNSGVPDSEFMPN